MKNAPSIIAYTDGLPVTELEAFARRIEEMRYDSIWVTEFTGRDPYTTAAHVLARTESITVATGIANIYAHDAIVAAQNRQTLAELSGGRFVLGLGYRTRRWRQCTGCPGLRPIQKCVTTSIRWSHPGRLALRPRPAPIWIAANGPKLLGLVGERLDGANTYLLPPAHTRMARELIGRKNDSTWCCPVACAKTPTWRGPSPGRRSRSTCRCPPTRKNGGTGASRNRIGLDGGSDRLIDMIVAWGDEARFAPGSRSTRRLERRTLR